MNPNNNLFALLAAVTKESVETPHYFGVSIQPATGTPFPPRPFTTLSRREESLNFWLAEIRRRNAPVLWLKRQCAWVFLPLRFRRSQVAPCDPAYQ
jgi:hypothetical protein